MTRSRLALGATGERVATAFLRSKGYRIEDVNVRLQRGELDIVAWDGDILVFVEVRTRRGGSLGPALASVDRRKQRQIITVARKYLHRRGLWHAPCRFDVIAVTWRPAEDGPAIEHIKAAFSLS